MRRQVLEALLASHRPLGAYELIDRLEVRGGIAAVGARAGVMQGLQIGAAIQQQPDDLAGPAEHGVVRPIGEVKDGFHYPSVAEVLRVTITPGPTAKP